MRRKGVNRTKHFCLTIVCISCKEYISNSSISNCLYFKTITHQKIAEISVWVGRWIGPFSFTHDFCSNVQKMRLLALPSCTANVSSVFIVPLHHTIQNFVCVVPLQATCFKTKILSQLRQLTINLTLWAGTTLRGRLASYGSPESERQSGKLEHEVRGHLHE